MTSMGEDDDVEDDLERSAEDSAPFDPLIADRLAEPESPSAIYLEEASPYRPVSTGDIFDGLAVPGPKQADAPMAMIIAHPSAMRRGPDLEPWARAAPVVPLQDLSKKKWTNGHIGVFPLPLLCEIARESGFEIENRGWGAQLEFAAPIETTQLDVGVRLACLSPVGIHLLLQRLVHADTRVPVRDDTLAKVFAPKLEELEMLQTWNEELVAPKVEAGGNLPTELLFAAKEFDAVMNEESEQRPVSLRKMLEADGRAGEAHRLFASELRSRRSP